MVTNKRNKSGEDSQRLRVRAVPLEIAGIRPRFIVKCLRTRRLGIVLGPSELIELLGQVSFDFTVL